MPYDRVEIVSMARQEQAASRTKPLPSQTQRAVH